MYVQVYEHEYYSIQVLLRSAFTGSMSFTSAPTSPKQRQGPDAAPSEGKQHVMQETLAKEEREGE